MKTYTVSDVAQMLDVDQETVRRWIRKGKLETEGKETLQGVPKKVTEESLVTFASSNKKYGDRIARSLGAAAASAAMAVAGAAGVSAPSTAIAAVTATAAATPLLGVVSAVVAGFNVANAIDAARAQGVNLGDLANGIASTAEAYRTAIIEKQSQIAKLEFEIKTDREAFERCGEWLNKINAAIEDEMNSSDNSQEA